jgi:hypothetical protein
MHFQNCSGKALKSSFFLERAIIFSSFKFFDHYFDEPSAKNLWYRMYSTIARNTEYQMEKAVFQFRLFKNSIPNCLE